MRYYRQVSASSRINLNAARQRDGLIGARTGAKAARDSARAGTRGQCQGQPAKAVGTLFVMHVAIALVTYSALVYLAPVRVLRRPSHRAPQRVGR